jgi:tRNA-dihydrouridine synthase
MDERFDLALRHMEILAEEVSERFSVLNMRKFFGWYSKGMAGGAEFRQQVFKANSMVEVRQIVNAHRGSTGEGEEQKLSFPDLDDLQVTG